VLRDEAALAVESGNGCGDEAAWPELASLGRDLATVRHSMPVVTTRVDRAMARASEKRTATALETAGIDGIERALAADAEAAAVAADRLNGQRVVTLSRSGTVTQALEAGTPAAVLVAESRPGAEGVGVAETLVERLSAPVTLTSDAALAHQLDLWDADLVLVGADAILADGSVLNKVGTRGAAIAAAYEGLEVLVATAADKIRDLDEVDREERSAAEFYAGDATIHVANPTFDVTPAAVVDAVATERGVLDSQAVSDLAREHGRLADWRSEP
jgi:translation initiation factor 2B subunit (eIF-2B alpha/beta/delta family)